MEVSVARLIQQTANVFFLVFPRKYPKTFHANFLQTRQCQLSPIETMLKHVFLEKKKIKKIRKQKQCYLLKIVPRVLSVSNGSPLFTTFLKTRFYVYYHAMNHPPANI